MGKKQGTQTVTQDAAPWGPAQGSLQFGLDELNQIYRGRTPAAPTREQFTTTTQAQQGGIDPELRARYPYSPQLWNREGTPGTSTFDQTGFDSAMGSYNQQMAMGPPEGPVQEFGLLGPAAEEMRRTIAGERMGQNPNLDDVIARARADVNSQFAGMSRYGSGAHMDQLFSRAAAPIRYADYDAERQRQLAAVQAAPGFEMAPYQLYSAREAAPYEGLSNYLGMALPIARGGSTGTQSNPIYKNPLLGAAGGAAGGASIASAVGATGGAAWPYVLGGALAGGFGS